MSNWEQVNEVCVRHTNGNQVTRSRKDPPAYVVWWTRRKPAGPSDFPPDHYMGPVLHDRLEAMALAASDDRGDEVDDGQNPQQEASPGEEAEGGDEEEQAAD